MLSESLLDDGLAISWENATARWNEKEREGEREERKKRKDTRMHVESASYIGA